MRILAHERRSGVVDGFRKPTMMLCAMLLVLARANALRLGAQATPIATVGLTPGWATFGEAVPQGAATGGLQVGTLLTQTDVKNRWPDGSIRFAIVTVSVPASASYDVAPAAAASGAFTPSLPDASVTLTLGGVRYTAAMPRTISSDLWLSGPLASEGRSVIAPTSTADGSAHPFLRVNFDARAYSDGKARIDVSVENLLDKVGATTVTYDATIIVNGQIVFAQTGVQHYYLTRWRKIFEVGPAPLSAVTPDVTPFDKSNALPPYLSLVANRVNIPTGTAYDILREGALAANMPGHGGRQELAPFPDWTARYLVHKDPTQRGFVLANGDLSGSWPVHVREAEGSTTSGVGPERLVSLDQRPAIWYDARGQSNGFDYVKGTPMPIVEYGSLLPGPGQTALIPDNAHQPSLAYVPYLLTGDRYYAEEMAFWANYSMIRTYNGDGVRGSQGILAYNETRGYAWALRNIVDAAAYYPDGSAVKTYLSQKVASNLQWLDNYANAQSAASNPFRVMWLGKRPDGPQYIGMWEQNYLAYAIDRATKQGFGGGLAHRDAIAKFQVRLFNSDPDYPRAQGAPYVVGVGTPSGSNFIFFTTMAQIWTATLGNERPFAGYYGPEARLNLMIGVENGWAGAQAAYDYLWPFIGSANTFCPSGGPDIPDLACRAGWALDFSSNTAPSTAPAQMINPASGSILTSSSQTFSWTSGTGVSSYTLDIGTTVGGTNVFAGTAGPSLSVLVTGLPTGGTLFARLSSNINGAWQAVDYTYSVSVANQPPTLTWVAPANGASYPAPATLTLSATGSDPEGRMARVEFYAGTTLLATNTTTPYAFTWSAVPAGTYALKAIAYDADGGTTASPLVTVTVSAVAPAPAPSGLVTSLTEVGRFDLSADFAYGGRGLAYVPGSPEGLIVSGFGRWPLTAKVSIPTGGIAAFLQGLTDPTEGKSPSVNPSSSNDKVVGGYWAFGSQLLVSVFDTYDGGGTQVLSQFLRPLDLSVKGQVQGPCRAGPLGAGFYDGYVGAIPAEWQTRLGGSVMIGNGGLNVIGRTSLGPAAFATNPAQTCAGQNATPLVYYPLDHPTLGSYGTAGIHPVFNGTTRIDGVVFPVGTSSVLFFGRTGFGNYCYGLASDCGNDTAEKYKGTHAQPYGYYIWAYDANDLAAVVAGTKQPWDVVPYATWEPLPRDGGWDQLLGAAYDPATGRIFLESQSFDNAIPTIHVMLISAGPALVNVPNVVGLTQAAAITAITAAGLITGSVTNAASSTVPAGAVISENPAAGASVSAGSAVGLAVSTGNDTTPPTVSMTAPSAGATVSGATVTVSAAASDNVGVAGVQFKLDGAILGTEVTTPPYSITWNTTTTSNGSHALTAVARDGAGNTTTAAAATVTVTTTTSPGLTIDAVAFGDRSGGTSTKVRTGSFSTTQANELLLAFVAADDVSAGNTVTGVTGAGLTWVLVRRTNTQRGTSEIWRTFATGTLASVSVTATLAQAASSSVTVVSVAGADTSGTNGSGAIGATASASANSGAPIATLTTTRNSSWIFGVGNDWDRATARTLGTSQTLVHQYLATVGDTYWVQRRSTVTTLSGSVVAIDDAAPSGDQYNLTICEILAKP